MSVKLEPGSDPGKEMSPGLLPEPIEGVPEKMSRFPVKTRNNAAADDDGKIGNALFTADADANGSSADANDYFADADRSANNNNGSLLDFGNSTNGFRVGSSKEEGIIYYCDRLLWATWCD